MSQENEALVRRAGQLLADSYEAGEATQALLELCSPELRVDASRRVFNPELYEGHEGMRRVVREICEAWEDFTELDEGLLAADDKVVSLQRIRGRGRASGVVVEAEGALIWTVSEGRVVQVEAFSDRAEALAAAGVEPAPRAAVVRRFLEHVNAEEIEAALSHVAPEAVLDWSDSQAPDRGVYRGPEGWGSWLAGRSESLADARFEVQELIETGPDTVVLVAHMHGRGRASGLAISALGAGVCTVSGGLLTGLTLYQSREEALGAVGLSAGSIRDGKAAKLVSHTDGSRPPADLGLTE